MMILPSIKLRAEFKPLLSLLSLSLEFSKKLKTKVRIIIECHQITVESHHNSYLFELEGLTLSPESCRSLRWSSSTELQLTLQARKKNESSDSNGFFINHKSSPTNQDFLVSRIQSSQNHCQCVGCGVRIFKSHNQFKRVLPLPSENWSDFADIWFCHNHSHNASDTQQESVSCSGDGSIPDHVKKLKRFPMLPRVDDCLVSSLYMLVHSSHVKTGCVIQTAGRLICKRCGNFIGFVKDERSDGEQSGIVYKIYHHAVRFTSDESVKSPANGINSSQESFTFKCEKQQHVEDFMCCLLRDQSHLFTSFRFILTSSLQAKDQSSISVLLWLLDQEMSVYSGQLPSSVHSNETCLKMSSCKYMKLLYKATFITLGESNKSYTLSKASSVFEAWRVDNTVHGITLPYPLCKQLIHLLVASTKTLTKSQRSLNGFHVGFLKVS